MKFTQNIAAAMRDPKMVNQPQDNDWTLESNEPILWQPSKQKRKYSSKLLWFFQ